MTDLERDFEVVNPSGTFLRKPVPEPQHACLMPKDVDPGTVWMCGCKRMWKRVARDWTGHGFGWYRVCVRYWWYRLTGDPPQ